MQTTTNYARSNSMANCIIALEFDGYNVVNLPSSAKPTWIFAAVINGITAPPTIIMNMLVIWTVLKDTNLRSVKYNLLLVALAVTDLLVGLVVQPLYVWLLWSMLTECELLRNCHRYGLAVLTCCALTLCTMMAATVERYLAIEHPNFYIMKVTTKKVCIAVFLLWATAPALTVSLRILTDKFLAQSSLRKIPHLVIVLGIVMVILFCVIKVEVTAHRQRKLVAKQQKEVQGDNGCQEFKRFSTTAVILLTSVLFYCPYLALVIFQAVKGLATDDFQIISHAVSATSIHLQSLVNPFIMSLRLSYIHQGIKERFCCRPI